MKEAMCKYQCYVRSSMIALRCQVAVVVLTVLVTVVSIIMAVVRKYKQ
jgi:hypothetical protein